MVGVVHSYAHKQLKRTASMVQQRDHGNWRVLCHSSCGVHPTTNIFLSQRVFPFQYIVVWLRTIGAARLPLCQYLSILVIRLPGFLLPFDGDAQPLHLSPGHNAAGIYRKDMRENARFGHGRTHR